jgi:CBS domain-containing protein
MELKDITKEAAIISEDATFEEAVRKMITEQANALIVIDEEGQFAGEVHVSDLFEAIVPEFLDGDAVLEHFSSEEKFVEAVKDASTKPVSEFMTVNAEPVLVTDSIMSVAASAIAHQHSRIPVVDHDNRPIGVISRQGLKHIIGNFMGIKDAR